MNVTVSEPKSTERELAISLPQESLQEATNKKIDSYRKKVSLPGFRAGKVPRKLVLSRYGDAIRQEALDETIQAVLTEQYKKNKIEPVAPGMLTELKDDLEADISFKVLVEVDPKIDVSDYQDLGVEIEAVEITAEEVENELAQAQRQFAEETALEDAAAEGDLVEGTYLSLEIDGESKDVPEKPDFRIEIGQSQTPEFDAKLVGLKAGEEADVSFSFPADYHAADLAGKKANYKVAVTSVKSIALPELNDEFAAKLGLEDFSKLKQAIEDNIKMHKDQSARSDAHKKAIDLLIEKNEFEVPEARIRNFAESVLKKEEGQSASDEEVAPLREEATYEIKKVRILEDIAKKEKIKAKQAEVDARIKAIGAQYGLDWQELKSQLRSSGRIVSIREEVKLEKALNFIIGLTEEEKTES